MGVKIDNTEENPYFILDTYDDDDYLQPRPADYLIVNLYFITLSCETLSVDRKQTDYLLLDYNRYIDTGRYEKNRNSIWSVPDIVLRCQDGGMSRPSRVGEIRELFQTSLNEKAEVIKELEEQLLYRLGIFNGRLEEGRQYIECKQSVSEPDRRKCYYVRERFVYDIDHAGLLNLADPEGLFQHRYFPLTDWWKNNNEERMFRGKRIPENVFKYISHPKKLKKYENRIDTDMLRIEMKGYLFSIDIVGFTEMFRYITENFRSFDQNGKEIGREFIARISSIFEQELLIEGISQYVIEGDGIVGAVPVRDDDDTDLEFNAKDQIIFDEYEKKQPGSYENSLRKILKLARSIYTKLGELVSILPENLKSSLRLRCVIHFANQYTYGKLSGLDSLKAGFSGDEMIVLSRMEQWFHEFVLKYVKTPEKEGYSGVVLALDKKIKDEYESALDGYYLIDKEDAVYRETQINLVCKEIQ